METEKNWLSKDMVWVVHKNGFSAAYLVKTGPAPQEGKIFVKLQNTEEVIEVNEEDVEKVKYYTVSCKTPLLHVAVLEMLMFNFES